MLAHLSHAQSHLVTREELFTIAPPPATATWHPIAHGNLLTAIERQLLVRGITIRAEQFAIQRDGARLFAVLDLSLEHSGEVCASMGIRTANDRSLALEIAVGLKVFVCDNLTFSGDLIALRRKHTAKFELNADISRAVDRYQGHLLALQSQVGRLETTPLGDQEAKGWIVDAFRQEILPIRYFKPVTEAYYYHAPVKAVGEAELFFHLPLVNGRTGEVLAVPLRGVIDLVLADGTVVEFKTSLKRWAPAELPDNVQLTAYSYASEALFGQPPKDLQLENLVRTRTPVIDTHSTRRAPRDYERLFFMAREVLTGIRARVFLPNRGCWMCRDCEYEADCQEWQGNEDLKAA